MCVCLGVGAVLFALQLVCDACQVGWAVPAWRQPCPVLQGDVTAAY